MEAKQSIARVSTRPVVLLIVALSALAVGLLAVTAMQPAAAPASNAPFTFYQDRPGPDSSYRLSHDVPDPWSETGK